MRTIIFNKTNFISNQEGLNWRVKYAKNCGQDNSVIKLLNSSIVANVDCEASSGSCASIQPYRSAEVKTKLIKDSKTIFESSFQICDKKTKVKEMQKLMLSIFGIPSRCPITTSQTFCYNGTKIVTFSGATQRFLPIFFGEGMDAVVKVNVIHDTGTSCFEAELSVI